ncbi:GerMN domain-containing protein [Brevibacillus laterosporus]|uniref:GerMN domain-containing protein n=1 Tax=Brevibacillus laterosporus TaxID=1465 RepID=A0AAP8U3U3_BRELA|nr:GerMN domain-containing protein [Brevibacillus laterosporus]MCR8981906.1 GerMN domain-containing protein [Brevibacillus laterosporus]MCZ0809061.1 GerMN domain-containing protein [Brevibacillus laterosporus]MCZ0827488.1 GerMN domain-containing protein [Brevibacillus laterosporus]MCZ0851465.1 GerMN domain-containing protein [Brevibacillus laterosporus]MED1666365.1 GerMN domain-containing protein [Brevibacillus laterosporus]
MKRIALIMCTILALLVAACSNNSATVEPGNDTKTEQPAKEGQQLTLTLYYVDNDLTKLMEEKQQITNPVSDKDKYEKAMELLEKPSKPEHNALWKNFEYHSITFENGTLTIDAKGTNQYNLGSSGEAFAIDALQQTMFQFPEVMKIIILVDGKKTESLMGHVSIDEPLTRSTP